MSCKYFYDRSNLGLICFKYFLGKTLHVEGNKMPKANLKYTYRSTRLLNLDASSTCDVGANRELQIKNEFEYENDFKQCLLIIKYKTS